MNTSITVSAPGKLMLFGEHAVVYNRPCIVTSVGERMRATITRSENPVLYLDAPDVNIHAYTKNIDKLCTGDMPHGVRFIERAINVFSKTYPFEGGVTITTASTVSPLYGFGSSSAAIVCTLFALSQLTKTQITQKDLFTIAHKTVLDVQGSGSGFDVASAIFGKTILFKTAGQIIEPIRVSSLPMIVGYSGVKADTKTMIEEVKKKMDMYPEKVNRIYAAIEQIVMQAKDALRESDWQKTGKLMTFNQEYLRDLGVSTEKLEAMISAAVRAGAYGAKISGAGGGDCMIAISSPEKKDAVERAIASAGGKVIPVTTNVEGVRIKP